MAGACGVNVGWLARLLPSKWARKRVCGQLLALDTTKRLEDQLSTTLDNQVLGAIRQLGSNPNVESTSFRGWVEDGIMGLIYLTKRNSNVCVIIPGLTTKLEALVDAEVGDLDWTEVGLVWNATTRELRVPTFDSPPGNMHLLWQREPRSTRSSSPWAQG